MNHRIEDAATCIRLVECALHGAVPEESTDSDELQQFTNGELVELIGHLRLAIEALTAECPDTVSRGKWDALSLDAQYLVAAFEADPELAQRVRFAAHGPSLRGVGAAPSAEGLPASTPLDELDEKAKALAGWLVDMGRRRTAAQILGALAPNAVEGEWDELGRLHPKQLAQGALCLVVALIAASNERDSLLIGAELALMDGPESPLRGDQA